MAEVLVNHNISVTADDEFIYADLPSKIKLKARATYNEVGDQILSRLDVMVMSEEGQKIIECFGDWGPNLETALNNNFYNFSSGVLHPLLAAFGCVDLEILEQITCEEWKIEDDVWMAFIGNLIPKTNSANSGIAPPEYFFNAIQSSIRSQALNNKLHWFRGYYLQSKDEIAANEFIMDNEDITSATPAFSSIPIIPGIEFFSCRNFIILKKKPRKKSLLGGSWFKF